jgi:hypothetical protein
MGIWEGLKHGARAVAKGKAPCEFVINGQDVKCPLCGHDKFLEGTALLNTPGMTFAGLDWLNKNAHTLLCNECSMIMWFGARPLRRQRVPGPRNRTRSKNEIGSEAKSCRAE